MSKTEIMFLDTKVYKGVRFDKESILDVQTHYKPTETFQYTNFYSCHPPAAILSKYLSEEKIANGKTALQQRNKSAGRKLLSFVTQYHLALHNLKKKLMGKWHPIQNQQRLREIFGEPPVISYRKGKSLKDLLVRAKLWRSYYLQYDLVQESCDARRLFLTISFLDLYLDKHHIRRSRTTLKRDKVDIVSAHIARFLVIGEIC